MKSYQKYIRVRSRLEYLSKYFCVHLSVRFKSLKLARTYVINYVKFGVELNSCEA